MSTMTIELSDDAMERIERVARSQGVTVADFIVRAADDKAVAVTSFDELERRAANSSQEAFDKMMSAVPDVEPPEWDRLP